MAVNGSVVTGLFINFPLILTLLVFFDILLMHVCFRSHCRSDLGANEVPPHFVNVNMASGSAVNGWIDSLSAAFAAVQVRITSSKCWLRKDDATYLSRGWCPSAVLSSRFPVQNGSPALQLEKLDLLHFIPVEHLWFLIFLNVFQE